MSERISTDQLVSSDKEILVLVDQLKSQYPTESDCFERLCKIEGVRIECQNCGYDKIERRKGDRAFVCLECRKTNWVTAGSFFDHVKKSFPWLLLIFLREKGVNINSNRFSKLAGIASSTAQIMYKKISLVLEEYMTKNMVEVSSRELSFLYGKRSRLTPANEHPISEQFAIDKKVYSQGSSNYGSDTKNLNRIQLKVLESVQDTPIHIDALSKLTKLPIEEVSATLVILELEELVLSQPGSNYIRRIPTANVEKLCSSNQFPKNLKATVKMITRFISREFHRLSRKYIQLYLLAIWSQQETDLWGNGKLLLACQRYGKFQNSKIRNYNSPPALKLWVLN